MRPFEVDYFSFFFPNKSCSTQFSSWATFNVSGFSIPNFEDKSFFSGYSNVTAQEALFNNIRRFVKQITVQCPSCANSITFTGGLSLLSAWTVPNISVWSAPAWPHSNLPLFSAWTVPFISVWSVPAWPHSKPFIVVQCLNSPKHQCLISASLTTFKTCH